MTDITENPAIANIIQKYVALAERAFKQEVASAGLVMDGDLLSSIRAGALERGKEWLEGHVYYDMLLRVKDLRVLRYTTIPPLGAMVRYVEKIGVAQFPFVPGYPPGVSPSSQTLAVNRIAWGLRMHFRREPNVVRGYRGVYNEPLTNRILPQFMLELREQAGQTGLHQFKLLFND